MTVEEAWESAIMGKAASKAYRQFRGIPGCAILDWDDFRQEAALKLLEKPARLNKIEVALLYTVLFRGMVDVGRHHAMLERPQLQAVFDGGRAAWYNVPLEAAEGQLALRYQAPKRHDHRRNW